VRSQMLVLCNCCCFRSLVELVVEHYRMLVCGLGVVVRSQMLVLSSYCFRSLVGLVVVFLCSYCLRMVRGALGVVFVVGKIVLVGEERHDGRKQEGEVVQRVVVVGAGMKVG